MFNKLKSLLGAKPAPEPEDNTAPGVGAIERYLPHLPILESSFGLRNGSYDNTYPSISRIADAVAEVQPIALNADGKEIKTARLLDVLNRPNKEMSGPDFTEALAVMLLVHPKVYLLAWRRQGASVEPGGNITEQNLAGLTFLEGVSERIVNGESTYTVGGKIYTEQEVLTLSLAINPYHLSDGYCPSIASKKWATTDDYIAEYHNAQFRNNARPAGMLTIVADSAEEFNREVDTIEAKFRGASNAGNTIYNMRPSTTFDGKPAPAKLEWTPFSQTNKDLTLDAVYNQANRKLESVFGVPDEVRGHLQNSNYASAEVADYIFARRVIYPILVKIYSKLTHELNRITGGLGYALSFHYEVPMLTDTRKLQAEALKTMIDAGFTVESSVKALRLPDSYTGLKLREEKGEKRLNVSRVGLRRSDDADSAQRSERPTASERGGVLGARVGRAHLREASPNIKVDLEDADELPASKEELVAPEIIAAYDRTTKRVADILKTKIDDLLDSEEDDLERQLEQLEQHLLASLSDDTEIIKQTKALQDALDAIRIEQTRDSEQELSQQLGVVVSFSGEEIKQRVAEMVLNDFNDSMRATSLNFLNQFAESIYLYRDEPDAEDTLKRQLDDFATQSHWRAVRFGFTEQQLILAFTAQALWEWAAREYNFKAYKTWHISPLSPAPCEECRKLDGEQVRLSENFSNGQPYPPYHPNCYCYVSYSMERQAPTKIACPKCGRFLMDAREVKIEKMICPNTKCKARLTIDTSATEAPCVQELRGED